MNRHFPRKQLEDSSPALRQDQAKPKHMHRRTMSKTSEDLIKTINIISPSNKITKLVAPQQTSDHTKKKKRGLYKKT